MFWTEYNDSLNKICFDSSNTLVYRLGPNNHQLLDLKVGTYARLDF